MLRKLIKHELHATGRILLPIYGIMLILSLVNRLITSIDIYNGPFNTVRGLIIAAYVISILAAFFVTYIVMIQRFYKNLMSDEGYLMFTLPVKPGLLISSKLVVSFIWNLFSVLIVGVSLMISLLNAERFDLLSEFLGDTYSLLKTSFEDQYVLLIIQYMILMLISAIYQILLIYVSIAVGHLFNGHKVLGSFAAYIAINTVLQIAISVIMWIWVYTSRSNFDEFNISPTTIFSLSIVFLVVLSTLYYGATNYIFTKKLNLE